MFEKKVTISNFNLKNSRKIETIINNFLNDSFVHGTIISKIKRKSINNVLFKRKKKKKKENSAKSMEITKEMAKSLECRSYCVKLS